jgi:L-lactate dehydrogenase (cytochrome)
MTRLEKCLNISDLRRAAKRRAHKMVFDYIDGGAEDEVTLERNRQAFGNYELLFKILAGIKAVDLSTTILSTRSDVPFILSPSAGNRLFHKDGERAVAKAAEAFGAIYCLSTLSSVSMEEIGALIKSPKWFQLYVWKDRSLVKEMLVRAKAAGFSTLILTADLPIHGNRERDPRNGFTIPPSLGPRQIWQGMKRPAWSYDYLTSPAVQFANLSSKTSAETLESFVRGQLYQAFSWDDAEWLLGEWNGPAVLKGVVRADDAMRALRVGFSGLMISNHGGRQLDHCAPPISLVENLRDRLGDEMTLIVDGGVRRGTDIIKALALGADGVGFARPYLYGLATAGEAGVMRALEIMKTELERDMALLGTKSISDIDHSFVRKV